MDSLKINYHNKIFRPISNSPNGEVTDDLRFHYQQSENILTCTYHGANISIGHLLGLVDDTGHIQIQYHQVNMDGQINSGTCTSRPELMPNGKIRLYESWQWTSGDKSSGTSILEEI